MHDSSSSNDEFEELLAFCFEADRLGLPLDVHAIQRRFPQHADELDEFLAGHRALRAFAQADAVEGKTDTQRADSDLSGMNASQQLGQYRLLAELGRGGMGIVYKAWQPGAQRLVAVKVISSGPFASDEERVRFRREVESAAQLNHPGLIGIHDADVTGEHPFYSMEYVEGTSLANVLRCASVTIERGAAMLAEIADAVAYAHDRHVLHRDLKPGNILIDAQGRVRVADFGLAKQLERNIPVLDSYTSETLPWTNDVETRTGAILGTPAYMAPEQAAGEKSVGPTADIYSLGAILYEMLTRKPPFRGATPAETVALVLDGRLEPVRKCNSDVPADLATIVEKCLERAPQDRYQTAAELALDLRRFLAGEPIAARTMSLWGRVTRAVGQRRHSSHFRYWGNTIIGFGATVFTVHFIMQVMVWNGLDAWWQLVIPRTLMFLVLLLLLRNSRDGSLMPRDAVERLVWVVWAAYFLAYLSAMATFAINDLPASKLYAFAAILGGMAFFTLGCHVWGACYLVGCGFFLTAPILLLFYDYALVGFGALWGISLGFLGLRYRLLNLALPEDDVSP